MKTSRQRKSGRVTPSSTVKEKKSFVIANCLEPQWYYDEWVSWRDGFRDWNRERKNRKHKRLLKIRKARKNGKGM